MGAGRLLVHIQWWSRVLRSWQQQQQHQHQQQQQRHGTICVWCKLDGVVFLSHSIFSPSLMQLLIAFDADVWHCCELSQRQLQLKLKLVRVPYVFLAADLSAIHPLLSLDTLTLSSLCVYYREPTHGSTHSILACTDITQRVRLVPY